MQYYTKNITELKPNQIFVFGSNHAGIHGAGAAKLAKDKFKAEIGVGSGLTGQCYALPTKDENIETISLININYNVAYFLYIASIAIPELEFLITKVGCGLAGYSDSDIAPMFRLAPANCSVHYDWKRYLE